MDLEEIDFDVHTLVEEVCEVLAIRARENNVELVYLVPSDVPILIGDPSRMRQVLLNLVSNAIKFTQDGEVFIEAVSAEMASDRSALRLSVRDSGIGIPMEECERLFDSFSQLDASTTRRYGGTGLGLAISRQLVELMGGDIGVESEVGVGSTFWFQLEMQHAAVQTPPSDSASGRLEGLRVLVVDDNPTNCDVLRRQLTSWRTAPTIVNSGKEALAALKAAPAEQPFELCILDYQMPELDGAEVAAAIRDDGRYSDLAIIVLSSVTARGHFREWESLGVEAFLMKPTRPKQLLECVLRVLDEERGGPDAAEEASRLVTEHLLTETAFRARARILLVEDNLVNQRVALALLQRAGYRAEVANNGLEALNAMKRSDFDLVLMDCQMPEMDGFQATTAIRRMEAETPERLHTPIIAMTANAMDGDRECCLQSGMDDYISKPVDASKLYGLVETWLARSMGERDAGVEQEAASGSPGALGSDHHLLSD